MRQYAEFDEIAFRAIALADGEFVRAEIFQNKRIHEYARGDDVRALFGESFHVAAFFHRHFADFVVHVFDVGKRQHRAVDDVRIVFSSWFFIAAIVDIVPPIAMTLSNGGISPYPIRQSLMNGVISIFRARLRKA